VVLPLAILPQATRFTASDAGRKRFTFILNTAGEQTVTVRDSSFPTVAGSVKVQVVQ